MACVAVVVPGLWFNNKKTRDIMKNQLYVWCTLLDQDILYEAVVEYMSELVEHEVMLNKPTGLSL